jgi:REP element-mobilizing transposase RayT
MARPLRIQYPGAFYHVINRGNSGEKIFKSDRDHAKFLEYLDTATERFAIRIHTYCLMTNHYHLLVETPQANLSQAIKWINVSYAAYFNRKRQRRGHLFQGRYKAILVDADTYLKHLSRYIHLNPLRANMVKQLEAYPWSSYRAFIGKIKKPAWLETEWLLSLFGKQPKRALRNYQEFVEEVALDALENPANDLIGGFLLGNTDFVNWIKSTFLSDLSPESINQPQKAELKLQPTPDRVLDAVCMAFDCDQETILAKGHKNNVARDSAIYIARDLTGKSNVYLGEFFGGVSGAAITMRYNHMAQLLQKNSRIKSKVNRIKKRIMNN